MTELATIPAQLKQALSGNTPYGIKALDQECSEVASSPEGTRNDRLNRAAFAVGQLVIGDHLERVFAEQKLLDAAAKSGLSEKEARATIASGLGGGMVNPRQNSNGHKPTNSLSTSETPTATDNDPWLAFTIADALADRPPVTYVVDGLLELPSVNVLYGPPGTLKSFLLQDLFACVGGGVHWLRPAPWNPHASAIKTTQAPSMWLDFDNGSRRTHDRFGALARHYGLSNDAPITYYSMPAPWLDAANAGSVNKLIERVKAKGAKLVCIDNLGTVSGNADENSAEMVGVMSNLRRLAEEAGAAVVVIHHQRKSTGTIVRAGDSLRGHSSIEAALDLALIIEREPNSDIVNVRATKTRGLDVRPFSAAFTYEKNDAGTLVKAAFYGLLAEDTDSDYAIEREIKSTLTGSTLNKTDLAAAIKKQLPEVGINRIRDRIDRMAKAETIKVTPKGRTERLYSL